MKLKSFFQKFFTFYFLLVLTIFMSCSTFSYNIGELTGENDANFLNHLYPIKPVDKDNQINETYNFCSFFIDEVGILYSINIELSKISLNNTDFWFYELYFFDYSPVQQQDPKKIDSNIKPVVVKFTQTSINPMTPFKVTEKTLSLGKNIFSWKNNLFFELKDKKNSIKIVANLLPKSNFTFLNSPFITTSFGKTTFFTSTELKVECEYNFYYTEKLKVKKKLKNGYGILFKSWGSNSVSEYEFHFLKFSKFTLGKIEINPPENLLNKSYIFFSIPKFSFYSIIEIKNENNTQSFDLIKNYVPESDYRYSKQIPDKNRRYPSNFSILLSNFLIRLSPIYDKSTVQFFTHDSWFGIVSLYDGIGNLIGLGLSKIDEYSRMKITQ